MNENKLKEAQEDRLVLKRSEVKFLSKEEVEERVENKYINYDKNINQ